MTDCRGIKLLAGNSNLELAQKISHYLGIKLGKTTVSKFSNGESNVEIVESVRNMDVYIIQSISNPSPNDHIMELLILIDAAKRASPFRITAVIPYLGYCRRDKKDKGRAPITSKLLSSMVQRAGANRIISVDLHTTITRGFWDIPVENLSVDILFLRYINRNILQHLDDQIYHAQYNGNTNALSFREVDDKAEKVVVSPDENGADRAKYLADILGVEIAVIYQKKGLGKDAPKEIAIVGNVEGKVAILIDDMADTCTKLKRAADLLHEKGAVDIFMLCTHGLFSGDAIKKISDSPIREIIVTNTVAVCSQEVKDSPKVVHMDVSQLLAESIRRQHYGEWGSFQLE